jgi:hypothetical protein
VGDHQAYARYDFATGEIGEKFDPAQPVNESRLNSGLQNLPSAREPFWFARRSCYCAGPVYYYGDHSESEGKLPRALDGCLITYDWNNGHMQLSKLAEDGSLAWKEDWPEVAMKYRGDAKAADRLTQKIAQGGVGVWGEVPMPPNPQYKAEQLSQMVDAILSLAPEEHTE